MSSASQTVAIIGAGAAGAYTAYRLKMMYGETFEIELYEKGDRVGGNAWTQTTDYGGKTYGIDCGAQFFYRNPQPSYVQLIQDLGLIDDGLITQDATGFCIWDVKTDEHRLWIPALARRLFAYSGSDWERLGEFVKFLLAAIELDEKKPIPWDLSLQDWLDGLDHIDATFREKVIKPFMYQFVSLPLARIGEASAVYAITYFVRNVTGQPDDVEPDPNLPMSGGIPLFRTYQSLIGLDGIMKRAIAAVNVEAKLNTPVQAVKKLPDGRLELTLGSGATRAVHHVVMACDPNTSAKILEAGGTASPQLCALLADLEYIPLDLSIQREGSCFMPSEFRYWEPVNTLVDGDAVRFSAWFGPLRAEYFAGSQGGSGRWAEIPVYKSWGAPDLVPGDCQYNWIGHRHYVLLPTTTFMAKRDEVMSEHQGVDNVWFAGGWTNWFDSQEAALDSATLVAEAMTPAQAVPGTGAKDTIIRYDRSRGRDNVERWVKQVSRNAPRAQRHTLHDPLDEQGH